jgi:multiple antibiotic resistance protein
MRLTLAFGVDDMTDIINSSALLLMLLNPFLVVVYLIDVMQKLERKTFQHVLFRAGIIASIVFCIFAILGDTIFSEIIQVEFASFQIFGGIVFLLIGLQFVFRGPKAIKILRGESEHLAGAIAMPVLIGPGTISASILMGERLGPLMACIGVFSAVTISVAIILLLKSLHDIVRPRRERLIKRYIEIAGRITALYIGTVSIEMIMLGFRTWVDKF